MREISEPLESYKHCPGPVLLLAGPGTGKTYQLEQRVKYLLHEKSAAPNQIAVITFTNEAARSMRKRLGRRNDSGEPFLPKDKHPKIISTMHSVGNRIIGSKAEAAGLPKRYDVLTHRHLKEILLSDAAHLETAPSSICPDVDRCRSLGICQADSSTVQCAVCVRYKDIMLKCGLIDYDEQIYLACKMLKEDAELRSKWRARTRYLLVDEYQDINQAQFELIQLLSEDQRDGLFVVGDDDQSIYSFRGGSPQYISSFQTHFGEQTSVGRLGKSWRCPEHILLGAKAVISKNYKESVSKPAPTFDEPLLERNSPIQFYDVPSDSKEAEVIAAIAREKIQAGDVAILIPTKNYFEPIKSALNRVGLHYSYRFSPDERGLARFQVLNNWIRRKDDNAFLRYLLDLAIYKHDALLDLLDTEEKRKTARRVIASHLAADLWPSVTNTTSLYAVLKSRSEAGPNCDFWRELISILDELRRLSTVDGKKSASMAPFMQLCGQIIAPGEKPAGLIEEIAKWNQELVIGNDGSSLDTVRIYNLPSSKGLEADTVMVVGLSKGLFPHPKGDMAEQSRLFYVAMTRAKRELHLFSARTRSSKTTYSKKSYQLTRSPFIDAIPQDHIEQHTYYPKKRQ